MSNTTANPPTVVLLHGLFGFRKFLGFDYFRGVPPLLRSMGVTVVVTSAPWAGARGKRAEAVAAQLADLPGPLHLVAHSMGGLDARDYIHRLGGWQRVRSLTTLGTPHRGSPLANIFLPLAPLLPAFADLTPQSLAIFNRDTPNHQQVAYRSFAAVRPVGQQPLPLRWFGQRLANTEQQNDGQVGLSSAWWGEQVAQLEADHLQLIGLHLGGARFDHLALYRQIGNWILQQEHES